MNPILNGMLSNVLLAAILFAVVMLIRRWIRNPAVLHLLLVLILVKLITPAYWQPQFELFPAESISDEVNSDREQAETLSQRSDKQTQLTAVETPSLKQSLTPFKNLSERPTEADYTTLSNIIDLQNKQTVSNRHVADSHWMPGFLSWNRLREMSFLTALLLTWGTGSIVCFLLAAIRILRFQNLLRLTQPASVELLEQTSSLAARIGLKSVPRVELISANISPLLWVFCSRARIILPAKLLAQLNQSERETLLLHELAHYRRRDHWVRLLELLATGIYWWNPLLWWLRREIRVTEEACCDAWVIQTLPDLRRAYAEVLVKAIGFVSQAQQITGATGIGSQQLLEQRLKFIMCDSVRNQLSRPLKTGLAVLALLLLPFAPIAVHSQTETKVVAAQDKLPTVEEILNGYHVNLQRLLPLEMTYQFHIKENMNCIHEDRRQLEAKRQIAKLKNTDITVDGKVIYDERTFPLLVGEMLRQAEELEAQLKPAQIESRLAGWVSDRSYFWSDGKSFQRRWAEGDDKLTANLTPGSLSPAALPTNYKKINIISAIADHDPTFRVWFGVNSTYSLGQGRVGNDLNEIATHNTIAPLGVSELSWPERSDWYRLDYYLTRPADQYRVVGWRYFRGRRTILLDGFFAPRNKETGLQYRYRLWIDPEQGYLPLRMEWANVNEQGEVVRGLHHYLDVLKIKSFANGYYPLRIEFQNFTYDSLAIQKQIEEIGKENLDQQPLPPLPMVPGRKETWEVTQFIPNKPMKQDDLALEFPQGVFYKNDVDGKDYVAGKSVAEPKLASLPPQLTLGEVAPTLEVTEWLDGNLHDLREFQGKVVALLFINGIQNTDYSNIPPEMQQSLSQMTARLKAFHDQYAEKGVVFMEIHPPGTTKAQIQDFHQFRKFETLAAVDMSSDGGGVTNELYNGVNKDLGLFLIGRDGKIAFSDAILEGDHRGELYWLYAANKLSIPLDRLETAPEEDRVKICLKIMEFLISEQFDYALSGKPSPLLMPEK